MYRPKSLRTAMLAALILSMTGCASIVSESSYPVALSSEPAGAKYEIRNEEGVKISGGSTPDQVTLPAGAGFFDGETYTVAYSKDGYTPSTSTLDSSVDGWYWGNILFGGIIGLFIIDPATGAMFKLPERDHVNLQATTQIPLVMQAPAVTPVQQPVAMPVQSAALAAAQGQPAQKSRQQLLDELAQDHSISYEEYKRRYDIINRTP